MTYFLFKVRRAWVIKYKPQWIYWLPAQGRARVRRCFRKMFSFQSNWKLSASTLPWDERQIKLPLALVWLQTKKESSWVSKIQIWSIFQILSLETLRYVSHPSVSKLRFKGRVIWTEKCGLTFLFLYRLSSCTANSPRPPARDIVDISLSKKSIEKEAEWKVWPLEKFSGMYLDFCENRDLEKKTEFVFFSVMAVVSFWVRFTGEIDNLTINNYKACQT